jgi:hypothetical protein
MRSTLTIALLALAGSGAARTGSVELEILAEFADGSLEPCVRADLATLVGEGLLPVALHIDGGALDSPGSEDRARVELLGGDALLGRIGGGDGERLYLELLGGALMTLPIDAFDSLLFEARIPSDPGVSVDRPEEGDRLLRRVAGRLDRVDGTIEAFSAEGVRFDGRVVGSRLYPWEEVAALFVEPLVDPQPFVAGPRALAVDLLDGSRVRGRFTDLDTHGLELEAWPSGSRLDLTWDVVRLVSTADGRLDYLSDLAPSSAVDAAPFGDEWGMVWPHRIDRAVHGGPLRSGGRVHARGIGVHAPSRIEWELDGRPGRLRGRVGVDDSTRLLAARGSVVFRIDCDGERAWESTLLRGGDRALELPPIDLDGVKRLALVVDPAEDAHIADRADWLGLRIVR